MFGYSHVSTTRAQRTVIDIINRKLALSWPGITRNDDIKKTTKQETIQKKLMTMKQKKIKIKNYPAAKEYKVNNN